MKPEREKMMAVALVVERLGLVEAVKVGVVVVVLGIVAQKTEGIDVVKVE